MWSKLFGRKPYPEGKDDAIVEAVHALGRELREPRNALRGHSDEIASELAKRVKRAATG